jgi:rhodanese-related sulfurtransferase
MVTAVTIAMTTTTATSPATATTPAIATIAPPGSRGIDEILAESRTRLRRLNPLQAHRAQRDGAVLVDIRPARQRSEFGGIPGALIVERNVLEWRFDPRHEARLPVADRYDLPVVVLCQEGYTSSLAAVALQQLGLHRTTDLAGGFAAWKQAGLPVTRPSATTQGGTP